MIDRSIATLNYTISCYSIDSSQDPGCPLDIPFILRLWILRNFQTGLACADYEEDTIDRISSKYRLDKNQRPSPSLDFVALMFGFSMHYYQLNLSFSLVGWFGIQTIASNSLLAGWFERLMISSSNSLETAPYRPHRLKLESCKENSR